MSSILTNNAAMTALQTLKGINNNLETTQSQISTGKKIASAKDNSAIWAISKTMEADVEGFKSISDTLGLGDSTVAVAKGAAESVDKLLTEIKGKVADAQAESADSEKIQADIDQLKGQIETVVGSAQFNGVNLTQKSGTGDQSEPLSVLSSVDRSTDGTVEQRNIEVSRFDLTQETGSVNTGTGTVANAASATTGIADSAADTPTTGTATISISTGSQAAEGDGYQVMLNDGSTVSYAASEGESGQEIAQQLGGLIRAELQSDSVGVTVDGGDIKISTAGEEPLGTGTLAVASGTGGTASGGLQLLNGLDVTTDSGREAAVQNVETLIQTSIDAAAEFGSAQNRIEIQSNFVSSLSDSLESGIGSLVDANMEEASARLQALQVQQQLGTQSLSIANQAPQSILSLFRG